MNRGVRHCKRPWCLVKRLMWALVIFVQMHEHKGCLEEERIGLLRLKAFLKSHHHIGQRLPSWIKEDADQMSSDCCGWERVSCNSATGHVIELYLHDIKQSSFFNAQAKWLLNVSLFQSFKELTSLDLSGNEIGGCIANEGFERLAVLRKLEVLNLADNHFEDNILPSLGQIPSLTTLSLADNYHLGHWTTPADSKNLSRLENLKTLDISYTNFSRSTIELLNSTAVKSSSLRSLNVAGLWMGGPLPAQELSAFENLERLDLSSNSLTDCLAPKECNGLSKLSKLKHLDLSANLFGMEIFRVLSTALPALKSLNLVSNFMEGSLSIKELSAFENLERLHLSFNNLTECLTPKKCKGLSKLNKLKHLDLSSNNFGTDIFRVLGAAFPALKSLNLSANKMEGPLSIKEMANLSNLEVFIFRDNYFPTARLQFQDMANLSRLEILDICQNHFIRNISPYIVALSLAKAAILLSNNDFNGVFPTQDLCSLKKLEVLDISGNDFGGILPRCINNMSSLRVFDISGNRFIENLSSSLVTSLSPVALEYIDLSHNLFEGMFSFSLFANYSKLEAFRFMNDNNKLEIETENPIGWKPTFQLTTLILQNCNLNKLTSNIPEFLFNQHKLEAIDLSHNMLKGSFPFWLPENNTRLRLLNLQNNSFEGQLQENIGKIMPYLENLNLSRNHFEGDLPSSIGDMSSLLVLDLSFNRFSGEVPKELVSKCTSLGVLNLRNNNFQGEFFSKDFNLASLIILQLNSNQFTGTLSRVSSNLRYVTLFDIGNNNMSGTISSWKGNKVYETACFIMRNNSFEGHIPCGFPSKSLIDLSYNSLSGPLPSCLDEHAHVLLQGNKLMGSIPKALLNSLSLKTLDIRENNLSGTLPTELGTLSDLRILLLGGNNFSGMIPNQLCLMKKIGIMDLSRNSFSGTIPHCFHNITFGKINATDLAFTYYYFALMMPYLVETPTFESLLQDGYLQEADMILTDEEEKDIEVEFVTKYRASSYKGGILDYMSGLDLSCNKLTGEIPVELGQLSSILSLNLSYNQLTGLIPETFSSLASIESLDLSHNSLSGEIPSTLIELNFIEIFNVAYNNLSGKVPDMKNQFGTFEKSSYEGNRFLCGPPLENSCTIAEKSNPKRKESSKASERKWYEVDSLAFLASFSVSYVIFFLVIVCVLHINPYWRQRCFNLIEVLIYWSYFTVLIPLKRLANRLCR